MKLKKNNNNNLKNVNMKTNFFEYISAMFDGIREIFECALVLIQMFL